MKKNLLFTALLAGSLVSAQAQTFSNAGFEAWSNASGALQIEAPNSWFGSDKLIADNALIISVIGGIPGKQLYKSTTAHSGTYAAELKTKFMGDTLGNVPCAFINAKIDIDIMAVIANPDFSNILDLVTYTGGTPILGRKVDNVKAWVKLTDANQDNASITVTALQKQNIGGQDTMVTIGGAAMIIANNVSNDYREITVPVNYLNASNTATDTLIVVFSSSAVASPDDSTTDGNTLYVDDVSMTTSDGTSLSIQQPLFADDAALVYPNPANDIIYFNLNTYQNATDYQLTVTDATGRVVLSEQLKQHINEKKVAGWAKGSYFYNLTNVKNGKLQNGKFSVQ